MIWFIRFTVKRRRFNQPRKNMSMKIPKEYKLLALRDCPIPEDMYLCDTADKVAGYWRMHVVNHPAYNSEVENLVVLLLNTRRKIKGHVFVSSGTLDTILAHPREIFKPAIVASASAIILGHNHPSGESQPSEADIKVTRELIRGGQLLKIEVLDHVIMGANRHCSLRELGYFFN